VQVFGRVQVSRPTSGLRHFRFRSRISPTYMACSTDRILGACLGTAVGDALGMPIEGISHQNVRTYYKGIKEFRADEQRKDLDAGQWTDDTQMTFALVQALAASDGPAGWPSAVAGEYVAMREHARRWGPTTTAAIDRLADGVAPEDAGESEGPTNGAAMRAAPLGAWWCCTGATREEAWSAIRPVLAVTHRHPAALAAGFGQAAAVQEAMAVDVETFDAATFWQALTDHVTYAEKKLAEDGAADTRVSDRLDRLRMHLDEFPLDMRDLCDGAGVRADEAWPYACAMFARRPHLLENTLLSSINVGGDADTHGAMLGSLLGALHGWDAFPAEWHEGLEARERLEEEAGALAGAITAA
jgi:ADP-ribosylglycohydrolase